MEKTINEEELKLLEEEIEQAVDRLFVEKKKPPTEAFSTEPISFEPLIEPPSPPKPSPPKPPTPPPLMETSYEMEKSLELEKILAPPPPMPSPTKWLDQMESKLLSLEWEITEENITATKEEVIALKGTLKENPSALLILNLMEKALESMKQSKENIHPSSIQFLLDSKETLRLLFEDEKDRGIRIYKQLALKGIEARFACLEPIRQVIKETPPLQPEAREPRLELFELLEKKIETISDQIASFSEKIEESLQKIQGGLFEIEQRIKNQLESLPKQKSLMAQLIVFKVDERLFGVESEKVVKLFRIPSSLCEKYANCERLQLKDLEVKMVNLKKVLSLEGKPQSEGEVRILTVKDNGGLKGLMIDEIIKKLTSQLKIQKNEEPYVYGTVEWTYRDKPVEISVLDLTKL